jgi:D-alanyl-lipoteichoic acid acyltransferase DltB (MBOAT superfamily)
MFFDSPLYLVFLSLTVVVYWCLRFRAQNLFLLAASYFFYGWWDWRFLFLMATSTAADFIVGLGIERSGNPTRRKGLLIFSVGLNLTFLGFFKYFGFFVHSFSDVARAMGLADVPTLVWQIALPPAISFYTFQEIAYIVDVYKGKLKASTSLTDYALFVSLFPHLIAGPIQQPSHLLPQVQEPRHWNSEKAFDGLILILEGLFRKVVIADNCALVANAAFNGSLGPYSLPVILLGAYAFAFQIYGDFSGYSSIARGSAQLLGFHFMVNFREPYLAQSLQEFWRRWHISLSTWLRDYLYIALGGSRRGAIRTYLNLIVTMLLGGLWHGANWTFVAWGAIHGFGLAMERLFAGASERRSARTFAGRWARRLVVFNLVCIAWVFFRSTSIAEAWSLLGAISIWDWQPLFGITAQFLAIYAVPMILIDLTLERSQSEYLFAERSYPVRVLTGFGLGVLTTLFGANQANAFIYFQF